MADINDVYAWTSTDAAKVNLAMTVSPGDPGTRTFGADVQYVFNVHSKSGLGVGVMGTGVLTKVICTFTSNTAAQCWVVDASGKVLDYASGDPSNTAGLNSTLGKFKVFAGRRSDPFFFNLQGFRDAVTTVKGALGTITLNAAGCPNNLNDPTVQAVRGMLSAQRVTDPTAVPPCPATNRDCFLALRVMAIVVQVDKTLLNAEGNNVIGVWGSTHMGS